LLSVAISEKDLKISSPLWITNVGVPVDPYFSSQPMTCDVDIEIDNCYVYVFGQLAYVNILQFKRVDGL